LRQRLAAVPLAIDLRTLRALWPAIAPAAQAETAVQLRLLDDLAQAPPPEIGPDAVVATFGEGQTLTAQAFVEALPGVEAEALRPDLRGAVETVVRDLLVTEWAREAGMTQAEPVRLRERSARLAARYTAAIGAVADTLSAAYTEPRTYDLLRGELFVRSRRYAVRAWPFDSAEAARAALGRNPGTWPDARLDTLGASPDLPLGTLAESRGAAAGPFRLGDTWHLLAVDRELVTYEPPAAVADELSARARALRPYWAHRLLLPAPYDPADVRLDPDALARALPRYDLWAR
jgi:hypothetical protein